MRRIVFTLVMLMAASAGAQSSATASSVPPSGPDWQLVHALPSGTKVDVRTKSRHKIVCRVTAVDEDTLSCRTGQDAAKAAVFQRPEIKSVAIVRRGRSALIGMAIGGGAGAIAGAATIHSCNGAFICVVSKSDGVTGGLLIGGLFGAAIGAATDFGKSTIYRAP